MRKSRTTTSIPQTLPHCGPGQVLQSHEWSLCAPLAVLDD
jgi:hypothetical protein